MPDNQRPRESAWEQGLSRTFSLRHGTVVPSVFGSEADFLLRPGSLLDNKYKILSQLGEGGMGAVYKAHHLLLDKDVALKTFRTRQIDEEASLRFAREAQAIARLSHPNIVQVFDYGVTAEGLPFYTMELLTGCSLADRIERLPLTTKQSLRVFIDVADALAHAHKGGIVHRDIKPGNIHLCAAAGKPEQISAVKVVDFGIAKFVFGEEAEHGRKMSLRSQAETSVGLVFGSPLYMSPEQSIGAPLDQRTDIYSFGCALFESLTGNPPFIGVSSFATIISHQTARPPRLAEARPDKHFSRKLESFMASLLEKNPDDRFQNFAEVKEALLFLLQEISEAKAASSGVANSAADLDAFGDSLFETDTQLPRLDRPGAIGTFKSTALVLAYIGTFCLVSAAVLGGFYMTGFLRLPLSFSGASRAPAASTAVKQLGTDTRMRFYRGRMTDVSSAESEAPHAKPRTFRAIKPYFVFEKDGFKYYDFYPEESVGYLDTSGPPKPCRGKVVVPAKLGCRLLAENSIIEHPELLDAFGPHDLKALRFDEDCGADDETFKIVGKFSDLEALDVQNCLMSRASLVPINKLTNLTSLTLFRSGITLADWSGLKRLSKIKHLIVSDFGQVTDFLRVLEHGNSLEHLDLQYCAISDKDIEIVSHFKHLQALQVNYSKMSPLAIKALSRLPELVYFKLGTNKCGVDADKTFAALPALKRLIINMGDWTVPQKLELQHAMQRKGVRFEEYSR